MNTKPIHIRFWSKVSKTDTCWNWTAGVRGRGYGSIHFNGKAESAHRVSYIINVGPIVDNLHVLHKCDNPLCVNPEHLFLGTNRDNIDDKMRKGRQKIKTIRYGEDVGTSKLTVTQVRAIREQFNTGSYTQQQLADKYAISQSGISRIVHFRVWPKV